MAFTVEGLHLPLKLPIDSFTPAELPDLTPQLLLNLEAAGYELMALIGVRVEGRPLAEIARDLAAIPEVSAVASVLGRFDLFITLMARDKHHLRELLEDRVGAVKGIEALESELALDVLLYRSDYASL